MNNGELVLMDFSRCWVSDRFITDDFQPRLTLREINHDWFSGFGIYQDFEEMNQQIPGYAAFSYRYVAPGDYIIC